MMGVFGSRTVPPLSPGVEALLVHERDVVSQPELVAARALARARDSLQERAVVTFTPRRASRPFRRLVLAAAAGLMLTAGIAAAYQMLRLPGSGPQSSRPRPVSHAPLVAEPDRDVPTTMPEAPVQPAAPPKISSPAARTSQEELQYLLRARQADARGDHAKVLMLLAQHQRRYPVGRLAEEREVLRVKALVALGQRGKARQAADRFRHQFPRSVLLHKVDEMLAGSR